MFTLLNFTAINRKFLVYISPIFLIYIIGLISADFYDFNFVKDCWYYGKPIIFFISGAICIKHIKSPTIFYNIIVIYSVVYASLDLFSSIYGFSWSLYSESTYTKNLSYLTVYGLIILLFKEEYMDKYRQIRLIIILVIILYLFSVFSRSLIIAFFVFSFTYINYNANFKKTLSVIMLLVGIVLILFVIKPSLVQNIITKFEFSSQELSLSQDFYNNEEGMSNWRGYESQRVIASFNQNPTFKTYIIGKGFGSMVDLGFSMLLGKSKMRLIPKLHNGYLEIFFKTGVLGILSYMVFFYKIKSSLKIFRNSLFEKKMVIGILFTLLINTAFTTGIYNIIRFDSTMFLLGFYLAFLYSDRTNFKKFYKLPFSHSKENALTKASI